MSSAKSATYLLLILSSMYYMCTIGDEEVDFNSQIKPILNKKCIACHGGVKQQSGLSFLFREEALLAAKSGKKAIVPGDASASELIKRIKSDDEEYRMPFEHGKLSEEEISLFEKWIDQGAKWGVHWAYVPLKKQVVPDVKDPWIVNDIDRFVMDDLKKSNLKPSSHADKPTLLRRASLDIIGVPAPEQIINNYLSDTTSTAYTNLLSSLLSQPSYGEKWTSMWLDLARYADSKGYESDSYREIWRYRDWLIKSFNDDLPYDQFLIHQLAGDLLPHPSIDNFIATAFHRNAMTNNEGGTENEEFRIASVIDRVNTTWSTLMGTSFNCVQCHSHPYDPFKHDEYYKFMAFFNNDLDEDMANEQPYIRHFNPLDSSKIQNLLSWINTNSGAKDRAYFSTLLYHQQPRYNATKGEKPNHEAFIDINETYLRQGGSFCIPDIVFDGESTLAINAYQMQYGLLNIYLDTMIASHLIASMAVIQEKKYGPKLYYTDLSPIYGKHRLYFDFKGKNVPKGYNGIAIDWVMPIRSLPNKNQQEQKIMNSRFQELMASTTPTTPIMMERPADIARKTYVFDRGNWTMPNAQVAPSTPHVLNPWPANSPKNRLGLAQWLCSDQNPLVARTMVNRIWEQLFGTGIVETLEDLGTQGMAPSHQALLDHLSYTFIHEYKWSVKRLIYEIMSSSVYQQSALSEPNLLTIDPYNKKLARSMRSRLSSEQIRDQCLAISGLLSHKMYGKSVMPYQPQGIWKSPYNDEKWTLSEGEDQYRRSLYTHWKRTAPYPAMLSFDAASREVCVNRRIRTNTPLQALTTLNDSSYVVMAKHLAITQLSGKDNIEKIISTIYEKMMHKQIAATKLKTLLDLYNSSYAQFQKNKKSLDLYTKDMKIKKNKTEAAALSIVINALFNLDEWINKN